MQWYILNDQGNQAPVSEMQLPELVQEGYIRADTMMWAEGMGDWLPASHARPDLFGGGGAAVAQARGQQVQTHPMHAQHQHAQPVGPDLPSFVRYTSTPLVKCKGWIRMFAILNFLGFMAILPIFIGMKLWKAADNIERANATGNPQYLDEANRNLAGFFKLQGIYLVLMLILSILLPILAAAGMVAGLSAMEK